jgi:hypothetical protein
MPARNLRPAEAAARILLDGLAGDRNLPDIAAELAALHPRNDTFPGEVFLRVAADALAWCGASRADPVPLEGMRDRFLAEYSFRGRERSKLQYAVLAAGRAGVPVSQVCRELRNTGPANRPESIAREG